MSEGRVPPHDLDAEAAVIASMILNSVCIDEVRQICDENAFYSDANRHIFRVILKLHTEGEYIELARVRSRLKSDGRLEQVGGGAYLVQITQATPAIVNVQAHARTIQDLGRIRRAVNVHQRYAALGFASLDDPKSGYDDRERVQRYLLESVEELTDITYERQSANLKPIREALAQVRVTISQATKSPSAITGTPTGIDRLDLMTAGLHNGDVTIVASRPGMGKTALLLSMARKTAMEGWAVPIFSLEMPAEQLAMRLLSLEARINLSLLRSGRFRTGDWDKITNAMDALAKLPIFVDDSPGITILDVRGRIRVLQRELAAGKHPSCTRSKIGFAGIDYLQLMGTLSWRKSREEQLAQTSQMCKRIAKELEVPLMPLSQLNREPDKRKGNRPELSDLRESGALEQDADNVLFVYRPAYYAPRDPSLRGQAQIIVAKQRNGPTGVIETAFLEEFARFENLADDGYDGGYPADHEPEDNYGLPSSLD